MGHAEAGDEEAQRGFEFGGLGGGGGHDEEGGFVGEGQVEGGGNGRWWDLGGLTTLEKLGYLTGGSGKCVVINCTVESVRCSLP